MQWVLYWYNQYLANTAEGIYHKSKQEIEAELEIITQAQKNPEKFAPIYTKYHDEIFLFINKRVDHLDATADLTSRCFLKCLKNIDKFKYQGVPFSSWLYRIAINEVNQFFRKESKLTRSVSLNDVHVDALINEIDYSETIIDSNVLISVLLEQLNENDIQYIELRFFEGLSFKEMSYILGVTEVNAKIKTYRILKKLKKLSTNIKFS